MKVVFICVDFLEMSDCTSELFIVVTFLTAFEAVTSESTEWMWFSVSENCWLVGC